MNADEKAQRLMLVTDIKFRLDNKTGDILESDKPISKELIKQAINMTADDFKRLNEDKVRQARAKEVSQDITVLLSYEAYKQAGGSLDLAPWIVSVMNKYNTE